MKEAKTEVISDMDISKFIIRNINYPLYVLYKGKKNRSDYYNQKYFKYVKSKEYNSLESNIEIQRDKLYSIIDYAVNNIPYYIDYAKETGFKYSRDTIFKDIKNLPVITKDILRNDFERLYKLRGIYYEYNTSGGSTGEPVKMIQDADYTVNKITLYTDFLAGSNIGDKIIKLWGSERDILASGGSLKERLSTKLFSRRIDLNSFRMSEKDMNRFVMKINSYKPKVILAYVQSIYELARYIEKNNIKVYSPHSIITSAGTLFPDFRETIERVFGCKVFNRYGSREVGIMAMECEKHEGLHLSIFNHYLEILDQDGNDTPEGEIGDVVVTLLTNYTMPLIRFKIGDMAVPTKHRCSCGRGFPLISHVTGRTVNVFKNYKKELIDGEYFTHLFYFVDFIKKFQVVQEDYEKLHIKLELDDEKDFEKNKAIFEDIDRKIRVVMGDKCEINYSIHKEIPPLPSGKYVYTISNI